MKDAKGHGSNGRSGSAVSARENGRRERERARLATLMQEGKITNQLAQRDADDAARTSLASGPKSAPVPTHDAMSSRDTDPFGRPRSEDSKREYDEYNRDLSLRSRNGQVGSGMKFRG